MREHFVYLFLDTVAEPADGVEIRLPVAGKPYEVYVPLQGCLYLAAGIKVVHVAIDDGFEHHLGMIWTAAALIVQFLEIIQTQIVDN